MRNQTQNPNQNLGSEKNQKQEQPPKKECCSFFTVKTLLVVLIFFALAAIIVIGGYLISLPDKTDLPIINPVIETQCEIDSDCELVYAGFDVCPPCDFLVNDYKCLNKDEAKEIREKWDNKVSHVFCLPCAVEFGKYTCKCENGKCEKVKDGLVKEVIITTDKIEYGQGETVEITVKNNLDDPIKHLKGAGCGLQGFSKNKEWITASSRSCKWDGEDKLKPSSEYNFNWIASESGLEKYRIAFYYQEQELIETKEIGKVICESQDLPDELEKLLLNGKWIKNDVEPCVTCLACGCSCTVKNLWTIGEAVIDMHIVSCGGNGYTIKYKGEEYNCVPENYKPLYEQASIYPQVPEGWETIYSNEFTIKEKLALDARCAEKVTGHGYCRAFREGYEFDSVTEKCIKKGASGCSFNIPFETLEECQEVCEKKLDTSSWQTYQHEITGVKLQHPRDWKVAHDYSENYMMFNNFYLRKNFQEIEIFKSDVPPSEILGMKLIDKKEVLVDGYKANRELFHGKFDNNKEKYYLRVFITEKDIFYRTDFKKNDLESLPIIFDQILSTFKFIEK